MNKLTLTTELEMFFQTLPPENNNNPDAHYADTFSNLFFRYVSEVPGEGLAFPPASSVLSALISDPTKDIFLENMTGVSTEILTTQEYSFKLGRSLDLFIDLLPQIFELPENFVPTIAQFKLSSDLASFLDPVFKNTLSTSRDLASAIVDAFTLKLSSSFVTDVNTGITTNWITS